LYTELLTLLVLLAPGQADLISDVEPHIQHLRCTWAFCWSWPGLAALLVISGHGEPNWLNWPCVPSVAAAQLISLPSSDRVDVAMQAVVALDFIAGSCI